MSQPVFATMLSINESTVQKWEAGAKHPSGIAMKMLSVVEKHELKSLDCKESLANARKGS